MSELDQQVETFKQNIIGSGYVLDPEGTHHEFVSGMHGRKLDFDNIEDDSLLYREWVDVNASFLRENYLELPRFVLGVANGTNRLSRDVASRFEDSEILGFETEKDPNNSKVIGLTHRAFKFINIMRPQFVLVLEDVGTTGSNSVQAAVAAKEAGAQRVEVLTTWKRRENLEKLDEKDIPHQAIIDQVLPTYSAEECVIKGFCAKNWEFIPRDK